MTTDGILPRCAVFLYRAVCLRIAYVRKVIKTEQR